MYTRRSFLRSGAFISLLVGGLVAGGLTLVGLFPRVGEPMKDGVTQTTTLNLPPPRLDGPLSVEQALLRRRSRREYTGEPLLLDEVAQLLWAAQGITAPHLWTGLRTAPSAGGLYPLETYIVVKEGGVKMLEAGVYRYRPHTHGLQLIIRGDLSKDLMSACVDQAWVGAASLNIVFAAVVERTRVKYGERASQYVYQESGHAAQNVYLQAEALGLGCVVIGAFYEEEIRRLLLLGEGELPVYVMPVGRVK